MENSEVTIRQIAEECGVSKSTAVRKFKEMNLPVVTRGAKGTVYLGPEAASALAHELVRGRATELPQERVAQIVDVPSIDADEAPDVVGSDHAPVDAVVHDTMVEMLREQIRSLARTNDLLRDQVNQLNIVIEVMRSQNESTNALLTDQIDRLSTQLASVQREKEKLRDELAMSRALEGFHFPWQRDRIMERYLLPGAHMARGDDAEYES